MDDLTKAHSGGALYVHPMVADVHGIKSVMLIYQFFYTQTESASGGILGLGNSNYEATYLFKQFTVNVCRDRLSEEKAKYDKMIVGLANGLWDEYQAKSWADTLEGIKAGLERAQLTVAGGAALEAGGIASDALMGGSAVTTADGAFGAGLTTSFTTGANTAPPIESTAGEASVTTSSQQTAYNAFRNSGDAHDVAISKAAGIDFTQPVQLGTLQPCEVLARFGNPDGANFTVPGTTQLQIGIAENTLPLNYFQVQTETTVLQSTAIRGFAWENDAMVPHDGAGGGTQYYVPDRSGLQNIQSIVGSATSGPTIAAPSGSGF